ncbi:cbb3-type cytochrome oxidase subunit 3 [Methanofollis sp. W23]|uniref:DUF4350 domain-containing protein n=1 Tax=Methanofollis sp. W23 TaxID=2817849 RepID=UPI001AE8BA9D|nr:DUF4350 domain-containing protein [Methanofollis sp. W23]MBP2147050.1 cbb3-type cytochrome oxidase subunit 3 [Methanofollis sp. W23]
MRTRYFVAVAVLLLCLYAAVFHLSTTYDDYSRYNVQWNGTSTFFSHLEGHGAQMVTDRDDLITYDNALLLVIAPDGPPDPERARAYRNFLAHNNTLLLCDDTGEIAPLLEGLQSTISVLPGTVSSVERDYVTTAAVRGYAAGNHTLIDGVPAVLFNRPMALEGGTPFLQTSLLSWADENGNGRIDGEESVGRYDLVAYEEIGGGELVVVGDPGIFLNSMAGLGEGNEMFLKNLLSLRPVVLVDEGWSRTSTGGPYTGAILWVKDHPIVQIGIVALFIGGAVYVFRKRIRKEKKCN